MYIAIEGIKGSGKSTLMKSLLKDCRWSYPDLTFFPFTEPMPTNHPLEQQLLQYPELAAKDSFAEMLYLERAYWHHSLLPEKPTFYLGDRSVATALVTRWNTWQNPFYTIRKVKQQYKFIKPLDVMIWLKTDVDTAHQHISGRVQKLTGKKQESLDSLKEAAAIYEELFSDKLFSKKMNKTQLIVVDNRYSQLQLKEEIQNIIKFYSQS